MLEVIIAIIKSLFKSRHNKKAIIISVTIIIDNRTINAEISKKSK